MPTELVVANTSILPMTAEAVGKVRQLEFFALQMPQVGIPTSHTLHAGMYARTIVIPSGVMLTGALIKIATLLIAHGDVEVFIGDSTLELNGYNVLPASANRKQAFMTKSETHLTMVFPSQAKTVEEAENEFTDEVDALMSRRTGE